LPGLKPRPELCFKSYDSLDHKLRIKLMAVLFPDKAASEEDLSRIFSVNRKVLSYHLSILEEADLIKRSLRRCRQQCSIKDNGKEMLEYLGVSRLCNGPSSDFDQIADEALTRIPMLQEDAFGKRNKWISVLGAFDTWPYMDYASTILADMGYTVLTSRGKYRKIGRILFQGPSPDPNRLMGKYLYRMIEDSSHAVMIYSVSGGHYIETDWCWNLRKKTLGLAFVREILPFGHCGELRSDSSNTYSVCHCVGGTAWNCIARGDCPFKKQGISLNVIEYYLRRKEMKLVAVNKIPEVRHVLEDWLNGMI
jgi:DNA-binding transcriptional ArsR family regulator